MFRSSCHERHKHPRVHQTENSPVVDDEPLRLRELTTDALDRPRVGTAAPALLSPILGRTLVASLITSFRINGARIRTDLAWTPAHPGFRGAVAATATATA